MDVDSLDAAVAQDPSQFNINHISDDLLVEESGKLVFLIDLLENLRDDNHRCLVFSSSRRMLDIVEKVMKNKVRLNKNTTSLSAIRTLALSHISQTCQPLGY